MVDRLSKQHGGGSCRRGCPYHVDKGGDEEEQDGDDAHQGAVPSRLDNLLGQCLQGSWENLRKEQVRPVVREDERRTRARGMCKSEG